MKSASFMETIGTSARMAEDRSDPSRAEDNFDFVL